MHEAKTHLSNIVKEVANGDTYFIAKAGKPLAMLVPIPHSEKKRVPGLLKGKIKMADDFDDFDKDLEEMFYG
jgi:prevent-host-death family protein